MLVRHQQNTQKKTQPKTANRKPKQTKTITVLLVNLTLLIRKFPKKTRPDYRSRVTGRGPTNHESQPRSHPSVR